MAVAFPSKYEPLCLSIRSDAMNWSSEVTELVISSELDAMPLVSVKTKGGGAMTLMGVDNLELFERALLRGLKAKYPNER